MPNGFANVKDALERLQHKNGKIPIDLFEQTQFMETGTSSKPNPTQKKTFMNGFLRKQADLIDNLGRDSRSNLRSTRNCNYS